MNFEGAQRVKKKKATASKEAKEAEARIASQRKEEALNYLKTRRIFKDMLDGREELFKTCKEYLFIHALVEQTDLGGNITSDFIAGFRYALETFEAVNSKYKQIETEYNDLMSGRNK